MQFDAFIKDITDNQWKVHGVEVYRDGNLEHSFGDTRENRYPIYSATKTITSIAAGMAWDEGKLDITAPVLSYLPSEIVGQMSSEQRNVYRIITPERLMTMSVKGYPFRPEGESWLRKVISLPLPDVSEREFHYSNVSAYLVGVIATCALQEDLYSYLQRKLFTPLGIENPAYERCPDGFFYGASKMELSVNELSRIGLLLYRGGCCRGERILSEEYVKRATGVQLNCREGGYGYFIWKYRNGFSINGKWKQKCYILPQEGYVITYLSHIEEESNALKESMEKHILGI